MFNTAVAMENFLMSVSFSPEGITFKSSVRITLIVLYLETQDAAFALCGQIVHSDHLTRAQGDP